MSAEAAPPSGARLWLFRLAAATLAPLLALLAAEGGLRLAGYGHRAGFLVPVAHRDGTWTTNPRYGWRFFPRRLARAPVPLEIPDDKGDAHRVFVLGGSAARGTPDPAYGFGRMLEVLLEAAHPGGRFEVYNAAMTAINSHVALDVARACARRDPDLFVVYLGNNEVVGPYGAGTVFGAFSPSLTAIRAAIAAKATRLGQLFAAALGDGGGATQWRGMEMFLGARVASDDPRLDKVVDHFRRNLVDLTAVAAGAGARTLLVTVATNLVDQPPFASLQRPDLSVADAERWQTLLDAGERAAGAGDPAAALASWQEAAVIDDRHAGLHFRIGRALLALGRVDEARERLTRARDLDALRFRADSAVNATIRQVAREQAARGVTLLDAEELFAREQLAAATRGVPGAGRRLFHEHVHLDFDGNLALARAVAEHLAARLPERLRERARRPEARLPSRDEVAERLAFTPFDAAELEGDILRLVSRPPFAGLPGHAADLEARRLRLAELKRRLDDEAWRDAEALYARALERDAGDLELRRRFATLLAARGRPADAARHWRLLVDRLPGVAPWRAALASALADAGRGGEALAELERLRRDGGDSAPLAVQLGTVYEALGRGDDAEAAYRRALELDPAHAPAAFNLATAAMARGELERAARLYRRLLERHGDFAPGHHHLGRCLERQGDLQGALAAYRRAVAADPALAPARNSLALALERAGDADGALAEYRRTLAYEPRYALARFNLADLLLARGRAAEAEAHYAAGLAIRPDNVQARYNHAGALKLLGRDARAAAAFTAVLAARPGDPGALHNLAWILATSEVEGVRDPARAVELAEAAVAATGGAPEVVQTLAVAYRAAGRDDLARALDRRLAGLG